MVGGGSVNSRCSSSSQPHYCSSFFASAVVSFTLAPSFPLITFDQFLEELTFVPVPLSVADLTENSSSWRTWRF